MIEILNGIKETVIYKDIEGFKLHDNTDYEIYPEHWHTPIEIIMPIKNYYHISCKKEILTVQEGDLLLINSGVIHGMPSTIHGERLILQTDFSLLHNVAAHTLHRTGNPRTAARADAGNLPGILQRFYPDQCLHLLQVY